MGVGTLNEGLAHQAGFRRAAACDDSRKAQKAKGFLSFRPAESRDAPHSLPQSQYKNPWLNRKFVEEII